MSASKKRRKPPEEDLAAAVAEIINSPITRSNLSFLRPVATSASSESEQPAPKPMGLEVTPMGVKPTSAAQAPKPMGVEQEESVSDPPIGSGGLSVSCILEGHPA